MLSPQYEKWTYPTHRDLDSCASAMQWFDPSHAHASCVPTEITNPTLYFDCGCAPTRRRVHDRDAKITAIISASRRWTMSNTQRQARTLKSGIQPTSHRRGAALARFRSHHLNRVLHHLAEPNRITSPLACADARRTIALPRYAESVSNCQIRISRLRTAPDENRFACKETLAT